MSSSLNPWTALSLKNLEPAKATKIIASANTDTQVWIAPFITGVYGKAYPIKVYLCNGQASAATVILWDERLTESTPTKRGSNTAPLYKFNVAASADVSVGIDKLPFDWFQAGVAAQSSQDGMFVKIEFAMSNSE